MTLEFRQGGTAYDITVSRGCLSLAGRLFNLRRKVLVVTGEGVPPQYAQTVLSQCPEGWLLTIPEGETNKTLSSVELILGALLEHGFTRADAVVAVGGGVIGDTAGFAAACYMRGIDWYNVPTTLLSQADSSVGGKTGVNLHGVKNIAGAFHQPSGVLIDPDTLDTLNPRLFSEGLAEIIKMAATSDAALFNLLETAPDLRPIMEQVLTSALSIKIHVVAEDPTEKNLRAVLNFGHTIGHAIEAACGAEAGVVSGDRGRPWPREWEGPAGIRGTDGSLLSDGQRIPVGGMRTEGPKSSGNNSSVVEQKAYYHGEEAACAAEAGVASNDHGRPWPCEREGPAGCWVDGTELAPERTDNRLWEGCSEAEVRGGNSSVVEQDANRPEGAKSSGNNSSVVEQKAFYHGEAVAVGMLYMAEGEAKRRIEKLLKKYNLPTTDPYTTEQLMTYAAHDKKRRGGTIKLVRVSEIGTFRFQEATQEDLRTIIQARKK